MVDKKKKDVGLSTNIVLELVDRISGNVIDKREVHNLVVTTGLSRIANLINGGSANFFEYIAIGTGTTGEVLGDTALETEVARELATTSESPTGTAKWEKVFTFGSGESYAITEVGVLDSVASGVLMNRDVFAALNVDSDTDLSITITLAVANA